MEHRFYGASVPTANLSVDNLASLSSHEAVADAASLLTSLRVQYAGITKVISFGCSYAGSLTTFARGTLPHLIHGAVASSAPVEAMGAHEAYNSVVATSLGRTDTGGSPACLAAVRSAFSYITATLTGTDAAAQRALATQLHSCQADVVNNTLDRMWFVTNAATILQEGVQYARAGSNPAFSITRMCGFMSRQYDAPTVGLGALMADSLNLSSVQGWIPVQTNETGELCYNNKWSDYVEAMVRGELLE